MQRHVAFLRGINLGNRRLLMSRLKALFEELKFHNVETFIASGNVLFSCKATDTDKIGEKIARHLKASLGYEVDTFVRTAEEVGAIGKMSVFPEDGQDGVSIYVSFLREKLPAGTAKKLGAIRTPTDEFKVSGREFYWLCRTRSSDSEVWTLPETRSLRLPTSTMRNMTSIRKLVAKHLG